MLQIGNFFFRTRDFLFPIFYILLFLPFPRITDHYYIPFFMGLGIALAGQLIRGITIGLVYIVRGGKNRRIYATGLVTEGLFSHCRNPMYVGNILMIIGMSVLSNSIFAVLVMVPLFIFIYQAIVIAEENYLRDKFGADFDSYCDKVSRWFPTCKGIGNTIRANSFDLKKVFYKEYNTTFLWTLGATLLLALNESWPNYTQMPQGKTNYFLLTIGVLVLLYATVRFLKKRERRLLQRNALSNKS